MNAQRRKFLKMIETMLEELPAAFEPCAAVVSAVTDDGKAFASNVMSSDALSSADRVCVCDSIALRVLEEWGAISHGERRMLTTSKAGDA